jgi:predicted HicB family RNase H-like nuclease
MARKASPKKMVTKPVRVDLRPELHDVLRIEAAKARKSMAAFVRELVEKFLTERQKKGEK